MKKGRYATACVAQCEVIRVDSPFFLINSQHLACRYESVGKPLASGHYLALWPAGAARTAFGPEVRYLGPFVSPSTVRLLQTSVTALGLLDFAVGVGEQTVVSALPAVPVPRAARAWARVSTSMADAFTAHVLPA